MIITDDYEIPKTYEQGYKDAIDVIKGIAEDTFMNDTMKILTIKRWLKEQTE